MAGQLRLLQNLPQIMNLMAGIFASVGFVVFFTTCIVFRSKYWPKTDMNLVKTDRLRDNSFNSLNLVKFSQLSNENN